MELLRTEDPRDPLEKATRDELVAYAHSKGQIDIVEQMPAVLIRKLLKSRGLTDIKIPDRQLGGFNDANSYGLVAEKSDAPSVNAEEAMIAQWQQRKDDPVEAEPVSVDDMPMGQLRAECKRRGIKMARTDNMEALRDKLRGQAAY